MPFDGKLTLHWKHSDEFLLYRGITPFGSLLEQVKSSVEIQECKRLIFSKTEFIHVWCKRISKINVSPISNLNVSQGES